MSSTPISVYSDLDHRPPGVSGFNLKALVRDEELRARMLRDDPQIADALRAACYSPSAPIGVVIKQSSGEQEHPVVHSYKISCHSAWGPLDPEEDYVGMVLYSKDGAVDWRLNGIHCKSGYIYYKKTAEIQNYESDHGQVHGKLYVSLFDEQPSDNLVASGFAIRQGLHWRFNSGVFNLWQKQRHMGRSEQKIVKAAIERFTADGHDVYLIARKPVVIDSLVASATTIAEQMGQLLIREGQTALPPKGTGRNSILIHITWINGSKQKNISMRKSLHYMCYQLLLDIEAHTGKKASEHVLMHHGVTLPLWERMSNAGVCDGDTLTLQSARASLSLLPSAEADVDLDDLFSSGFGSQLQRKCRKSGLWQSKSTCMHCICHNVTKVTRRCSMMSCERVEL